MDFFNDDFGLGDSPYPKSYKNTSKNLDANKSVKGKDDFDDLLDQMLDKEKKKTTKQKNNEIPSFNSMSSFDKISSPAKTQNPLKKQESESYNFTLNKNEPDWNKPYEPLRNRPSSRSIQEDKGSQDNKSYKSGATGFAGFNNLQLNAPSLADDIPQFASSTRMMKPPLRKRADSKVGSEIGQDELRGTDLISELQTPSMMRPPLPKKDPSPPKANPQSSFMSMRNLEPVQNKKNVQVVEKQKIVYIKQDSKNIREQFDKQLKLIKQSHDKQIAYLREELEKQVKNAREIKTKLMREFEQQKSKDKQLYQMLAQKDIQKCKDLYEWQMKRKTQSYELEIQKLRKLIDISSKTQSYTPSYNYEHEKQTLQMKQKQLQVKVKRVEDQQAHLRQKERTIELRESEFDIYRKREEDKLQTEKKQLFKLEAELRKKKMQMRKQLQEEKISVASTISKQQFEILRQKEQIRLDREQLEISRQLFEKQKFEYEDFNSKIMNDYKQKLKQLQTDRNYVKQKQIQLYKKIQTVEMMGNLKAGRKIQENIQPNQENIAKNIQKVQHEKPLSRPKRQQVENHENPSIFDNLSKQKHQGIDESLNRSSLLNANKTNLKQYLLKVNRNNQRMRPFLA